jgi:drug/metabolite transporter (DMT)-like permease
MSLPASRPSQSIVYCALIASLLFWGGTSVVGKVTLEHFPLFTTLFIRFCIASLGLLPLFLLDRQRQKLSLRPLLKLALLGSFGTSLNIGLFFYGISKASILDTSVIIAMAPLFLSLAGWFWLKEKFCWHNALGIAMAFMGAAIALTLFPATSHHSFIGIMAIVAAELCMVVYTIGSKEILEQYSATIIASVSFFVAMLTFAPLSAWEYFSHPEAFVISSQVVGGLLYLGIASSVMAYVLYEWALNWLSAAHVAALSYVQPLSSIWLGMIFLNEQMHWSYIVGGVIVAVGVVLALRQPCLRGVGAKEVIHTRHPHHRS